MRSKLALIGCTVLTLLCCVLVLHIGIRSDLLYSLSDATSPELFEFVSPRGLTENTTISKEKRKVRAVVLVQAEALSTLHKEYKEMWLQYMNKEERIAAFFVYGTSANFMPVQSANDLIFPTIRDSYYLRLEEVLCAFNYVESEFEYDFIVRTNLNTFWIWPRLLAHLDTLPIRGVYEGRGPLPVDVPPHKRYYVSEIDTVISRGMIQLLLRDPSLRIYLVKLAKERMSVEAALGVFFHNLLKAPLRNDTRGTLVIQGKTEATESLLEEIVEDLGPRWGGPHPSHVILNTPKVARENVDIAILKRLIKQFY